MTAESSAARCEEEVTAIHEEIAQAATKLQELTQQYDSLIAAGGRGDGCSDACSSSSESPVQRLAAMLAEHRAWAEERIRTLTAKIQALAANHPSSLEAVRAVVTAYGRLFQLVSRIAAELHRASVQVKEHSMSTLRDKAATIGDGVHSQAAALDEQIRSAADWGRYQALQLRGQFDATWAGFGDEAKRRGRAARKEMEGLLGALGGKLSDYYQMSDTKEMRAALFQDGQRAVKECEKALRRIPMLGFTMEGVTNILNDESHSFPWRLVCLVYFLVLTMFHWLQHQVQRARDRVLGAPASVDANAAMYS
eukprot:TRINITY_DN65512_c0_g1_i1.p1 TRINITY_DN65512_c0_g1~~TRINITY_DN65512_c0_g1_i1.p1  ORF type:complete len:336 (+),score=143.45 TRINITY_DN65512_c0_g1_i1:82-1008(+)